MLSQRIEVAGGESFLLDYQRRVARALAPGWVTRIAARLRAPSLDRALISGADPASSQLLAARSAQLTSASSRGLIADGLERLIGAAQGPRTRWRAVSRGRSVLDNATELRELATLLRSRRPIYARGMAVLNELLTDGTGPAYAGEREDLASMLGRARTTLVSPC
ncbi:MAG TPA: hypothetical protein VMF09_02270 [Solirubrobacteraceae bacterium]|nr:hypothetical protein [Solirubrobacteraceae bacterium]